MRKACLPAIMLFCLYCICLQSGAQQDNYTFHSITTADGLNDGSINQIARDKYGYIWMASLGGLNRYNGRSVERFTNRTGDPCSVPSGITYSLTSDSDGRFWIGYDFGLYEYDFAKNCFRADTAFSKTYVQSMVAGPGHRLFIRSSAGFFEYHTGTGKKTNLIKRDTLLQQHPSYSLQVNGDDLLIGSFNGFTVYHIPDGKTRFVPVVTARPFKASRIFKDQRGGIWLSDLAQSLLLRFDPANQSTLVISDYPELLQQEKQIGVAEMAAGNGDDVWIATSQVGLWRFNLSSRSITAISQFPEKRYLRCISTSSDGNIWIGSVNGCYFFNRTPTIFQTVYPKPEGKQNPYSRAMLEDSKGNWWFTTGDGISRYEPGTQQYTVWRNTPGNDHMLYYNSVRGIEEDKNGKIWIATGRGINSYTPGQTSLQFYTIKDSIPQAFYYCANRDSKGRVWFGTKDFDGLYYYDAQAGQFHSVRSHPQLQKLIGIGTRIVFEDSKHRLWLGFNGGGLAMVDEAAGTIRRWIADGINSNTITGNMVVDIKEDQQGVIWISTFNGVTGIDLQKNKYTWLDDQQFFRTNYTGPLAVDKSDRLWVGTATGLYMVDKTRSRPVFFNEAAGLPGVSFTEHSGYTTRDGWLMMPTSEGIVRFNPDAYQHTARSAPFFIGYIDLLHERKLVQRDNPGRLTLAPDNNFFTIGLECLYYGNPAEIWFAYRLEGLESEWHYTQDPKAVYTSVPGGQYTFHYKAGLDPGDSSIAEKTFQITVRKVYYKTTWFRVLLVLFLLALLYFIYRYRIRQQHKLFNLENKAQRLEKEKVMVMYENLKQHLNPHFLFNSLTSLSSLIRINQLQAGDFLDKMSKVYRYILKNRDNETVPLQEELRFVKLYIELQQTRFEEGLQVNLQVEEDALSSKIAPVTLQNLVENAIKHNTADPQSPLVIDLYTKDGFLVVQNNLQKKKFVETSNRQGLKNMESLYRYLSERPMQVVETADHFIVKIPLL